MKNICCCNLQGETPTLCQAHQIEFEKRVAAMSDVRRVRNATLDAVADRLVPRKGDRISPTDAWILKVIEEMKR